MNEHSKYAADDEISYRVTAQRVLLRRTAQVTVPVELIVGPDDSDAAGIEIRVREALTRFLQAEWITSTMNRHAAAGGYERLSLTASARIPLELAHNLDELARAAGERGLSLGEPSLDYRVARSVLTKATEELRKDIVDQVNAQIGQFNDWTGRVWRLGSLDFGLPGGSGQRTTKGAYRSDDDLQDDAQTELEHSGGTERLQMVAAVTLRSRVSAPTGN